MEEILLKIPQIQFPHMGIYGDMGGKKIKKATQQKIPACRNAYVIRGTRLYELFIGTVSHVNNEENKEWKITWGLNRDSVTLKFDTWNPGQHSARTKKKKKGIQENQE